MSLLLDRDLRSLLLQALGAALGRDPSWSPRDPVLGGILEFLARRLEEAREVSEALPSKVLLHLYSLLGVGVPDPEPARTVVALRISEHAPEPLVLERGLAVAAGEISFETEEEILALPGGFSAAYLYLPGENYLAEVGTILRGEELDPEDLPPGRRFAFRVRFSREILSPGQRFALQFTEPPGGLALFAEGKNGRRPLRPEKGYFSLPRDLLPLEDTRGKYFYLYGESTHPVPGEEFFLLPGPRRITHIFCGDRPLEPEEPLFLGALSLGPRIYAPEEAQEHLALRNPLGQPPLPGASLYLGGFWLLPGTRCRIETHGIRLADLSWEYFDGETWKALSLRNREILLPGDLAPTEVNRVWARWIRIRYQGPFVPPDEGRSPDYYLSFSFFLAGGSFSPEEIQISNLGEKGDSFPQRAPEHGLSPKEAALYLRLENPCSGGPVSLYFAGEAPEEILQRVEVSTASGFRAVSFRDTTRRLRGPGFLYLYLPEDFSPRTLFGEEGAWVRLVLRGEVFRRSRIEGLYLNALPVREGEGLRFLSRSTGQPGQTLQLKPLAGRVRVQVNGRSWRVVDDLRPFGPGDEVVELDPEEGRLRFGDGVHGAIPKRGAVIQVDYLSHHGDRGNLPAGSLQEVVSPPPFVEGVHQIEAAVGGRTRVPPETLLEQLPAGLRHRYRALTRNDLEDLLSQIEGIKRLLPEILGSTLLLYVLPRAEDPSPRISRGLEERIRERLAGALPLTLGDLEIRDPIYVPVEVKARLILEPGVSLRRALSLAQDKLRNFLHPVQGNFDRQGFPFGQFPYFSDFYRLLHQIPAIRAVKELEVSVRVGKETRPYLQGHPPVLPRGALPTPGEILLEGETE